MTIQGSAPPPESTPYPVEDVLKDLTEQITAETKCVLSLIMYPNDLGIMIRGLSSKRELVRAMCFAMHELDIPVNFFVAELMFFAAAARERSSNDHSN